MIVTNYDKNINSKPIGWDKLREYQKNGAIALHTGQIKGLWYAAGIGKTATILSALELGQRYPALVITRTIGRGAWYRDAKWVLGIDGIPGMLYGTKTYNDRQGKLRNQGFYSSISTLMSEHKILVMNYELVRSRLDDLLRYPWKALVLDEAHLVKGGYQLPKIKRDGTKHMDIFRLIQQLAYMVRSNNGVVWELTATAIKDRPRDLWSQIELVSPRAVGTAWQFLHRYCGAYQGDFGLVTSGSSNEEELQSILNNLFAKISRKDVMSELPKMQFIVSEIETKWENTQTKGGGSVENSVATACEMKLEATADLIPDYLHSDCKVLVTVSRRKFVPVVMQYFEKHLMKRLARPVRDKLQVIGVTGAVDPIHRMEILNGFNEAKHPMICVATMDCLSESINLHYIEAAIVMGLPYTPGLLDQFIGRFARLGGLPCTIHFLVANGTIDERIRELLLDKLEKVCQLGTDTASAKETYETIKESRNEEEILAKLKDWLKDETA